MMRGNSLDLAGNHIGINPQQLGDGYDNAWCLTRADYQMRDFWGAAGLFGGYNNNGVPVDANNWPTTDFSCMYVSAGGDSAGYTFAQTHPSFIGNWTLVFTGNATVTFDDSTISVVSDNYNTSTNITTLVFTTSASSTDGNKIYIHFANTARTNGGATNAGVTNIQLWRPGYGPGSPLLTNEFLGAIAPFGCIRFMQWLAGYSYPIENCFALPNVGGSYYAAGGTGATFNVSYNSSTGVISGITPNAPGNGYVAGQFVGFSGQGCTSPGGYAGFSYSYTTFVGNTSGSSTSVTLTNPTQGWLLNAIVNGSTVTGTGVPAGTTIVSGAGDNGTGGSSYTIVLSNAVNLSNVALTIAATGASAMVTSVNGSGGITGLALLSGGSGWFSAPTAYVMPLNLRAGGPATTPWQNWNGVTSWELIVEIANAANKDIWINLPVGINMYDTSAENYATQLATYLKANLNPGIHVYVELGNEIWNSSGLQAQQLNGSAPYYNTFNNYSLNMGMAQAEISAGLDASLNFDSINNATNWSCRRAIHQLYKISQAFAAVYGTNWQETIRPVFVWQSGTDVSYSAGDALYYATTAGGMTAGGVTANSFLYGVGCAPYLGASGYTSAATCVSTLISNIAGIAAEFSTTTPITAFNHHPANYVQIADLGDLRLVAYESGPNTHDSGGSAQYAELGSFYTGSPNMGDVMQQYITMMLNAGFDLFCLYQLTGTTALADWGLTSDLTLGPGTAVQVPGLTATYAACATSVAGAKGGVYV